MARRRVDPFARVLTGARRRPPPRATAPPVEEVDGLVRRTLEAVTPPAPPNPATRRRPAELPAGAAVEPLPEEPDAALTELRRRRRRG